LQAKPVVLDSDAYVSGLLKKWDMLKGMCLRTFSYTRAYPRCLISRCQAEQLVLDLLNDAEAQQHIKVMLTTLQHP
jgi:hypothetical protein